MFSLVFSYEDYEEVFEPQCDMDFDGETDCSLFLSFASTNWKGKDYRGCVDQYKTAIYCGCINGDEKKMYRYLEDLLLSLESQIVHHGHLIKV